MAAVAVTAAVIAGGLAIVRVLPGARVEAGKTGLGKTATLEGLRGLLALAVVAHHLLVMRNYAATGRWGEPVGNFDNLLGKGAVAAFFMLSAYLFCGTMIARGGRIAAPGRVAEAIAARLPGFVAVAVRAVGAAIMFLVGRARRIMPAYLFTVLVLVLMVGVETRFTLREPLADVAGEIGWWALLGWYPVDINGFGATWKMFSVTWSLRTEMWFYLSVPLLALVARRMGSFAPSLLLVIPAMFLDHWALFAAGALAVPLVQARFRGWRWPALACLGLFVATQHHASGWIAAALLLPMFIGLAQGGRGFGWLGARPMVRLGQASYSLYLLHNPVIYIMGLWVVGRGNIASMGLGGFLLVSAATSVLAVIAALIVQHWVERPFMARRHAVRVPPPASAQDIAGNMDQHDCAPDSASNPDGARSDAATVTKELRPWPI